MAEHILVRVVAVEGSAPREVGAEMTVLASRIMGTIGGGRLEYDAMAHARAMLGDGRVNDRLTISLGPEIGQCCGGRVELAFTASAATRRPQPVALIYGAGHVGRALSGVLATLEMEVRLIDSRADMLTDLPDSVTPILTPIPEAEVAAAPAGAAHVIVTHDHGLDFLLVEAVLRRGDAAYLGMIGSASKRAACLGHLRRTGLDIAPEALTCPIGAAGRGDKRPEIIALHTAAEIAHALREVRPCD